MMMRLCLAAAVMFCGVRAGGQDGGAVFHGDPVVSGFPVVLGVDARESAGRRVSVDAQGKLLPWPVTDSTGYSYSGYFLSQWTALQDQLERQRLPYLYCCFAIEPGTYELRPDKGWANSTGYLRAMMEGFVERLYAYTGERHEVELLEQFFDYELAHGLAQFEGRSAVKMGSLVFILCHVQSFRAYAVVGQGPLTLKQLCLPIALDHMLPISECVASPGAFAQ
jgi:hypothetical protein